MLFHGPVRILLYGKDARTDALTAACAESEAEPELFAYSEFEIPGLLQKCKHVATGSLRDVRKMVRYAREVEPTFVWIGPEEPLDEGLVDALDDLGIPSIGPHAIGARIETSKSWARALVNKYGIPGNPQFATFSSADGIAEFISSLEGFVVKPDGLTGGKGVKVSGEHLQSRADGLAYAIEILEAHDRVVIEEKVDGEEFSLQTITDGRSVIHCPVVQDHKRADVGDSGANTGGMGSYSSPDFSLPFLDDADVVNARKINEAVIQALESETGRPYRGVLYGGFIATNDGINLIEYNARFGDPEAMNTLSIIDCDFVALSECLLKGKLSEADVSFEKKATVCKYVVPKAYPEKESDPGNVSVPDEVVMTPGLKCYWAAVNQTGPDIQLTGSRAIAMVGTGETFEAAGARAEFGAASVRGRVRHREDIGTPEAIAARIDHVRRLRGRSAIKCESG